MGINGIITINFIHFPMELLICEAAFLVHKPRREKFILRLFTSLVAYFVLCGIWMNLIQRSAGRHIFPYVLLYLGYAVMTALPIWCCFKMRRLEVLFSVVGAYATQHMCYAFLRITLYMARHSLETEGIGRFVTQYVFYVIWAVLVYFVFIYKNQNKEDFSVEDIRIGIFAVILAVAAVGLSVYYSYPVETTPVDKYTCILCPAYGFLCCALVLAMEYYVLRENRMKKEQEVMEQLLQMADAQQKSSKEAINIINIKCHDLKHQIRMLEKIPDEEGRQEYVKEIQEAVSIYDAIFHTGCEPLDYILREKCLLSNEYHVAFSCMADGSLINFMHPADIYALIGNAFDNALECVVNEPEEKRTISLHIKRNGAMILIHMENRCSIQPEFHNDLPVTNKEDKNRHGFGVRSMRYIAEKYNGELYMKVNGEMFVADILLPVQN